MPAAPRLKKQQTAVNNESGTEDEPRPEPRGATLGNRVYLTAGGGGSWHGGATNVAALGVEWGGTRRCSFCNRREASVHHLVRARDVYICDQCVALAKHALNEAPDDLKLIRIRPQPRRPRDRDAAETAIEDAFETVYTSSQPDDVRCAAIEGGANLAGTMKEAHQARQRFRGTSEMDVIVEHIRFVGEDEAEVSFVLVFPGGPLPRLPTAGHAVLIDGEWKVARQTYCNLVQTLGVHCPPEQE
jgi:hypothetical protein